MVLSCVHFGVLSFEYPLYLLFVHQLSQRVMLLDSPQMSLILLSLLPGPQYHDSAIGYKHCINNFLVTTLLVKTGEKNETIL